MSKELLKYAWSTVADYEKEVGFEVNDVFKAAWDMARTRLSNESSAQAEEDLKRLGKRCPLRCDFSQAMKHLKRELLSEGELNSLYYHATNQTLREQDTRLAFGFARAIEKAHGIGIDDENHDA